MNVLSRIRVVDGSRHRIRQRALTRRRPQLEVLEDRSLPAPLNAVVSASPNPIQQGDTTTLSGSFFDPVPGGHLVQINWGPGEGSSQLTLQNGVFEFTATHKYLTTQPNNAPFLVTATVADLTPTDPTATATTNVGVFKDVENDIVVFPVTPTPAHAQLHVPVKVRFGFLDPINEPGDQEGADPPGEFRAIVNWGDGSQTRAKISDLGRGLHLGVGEHTYNKPGQHTVSIKVTEPDSPGTLGKNHFAIVAVPKCVDDDNDIALRISARTFPAQVGVPIEFAFGFVDPLTEPCDAAEAPDPKPEFKAVIHWGDGTQTSTTDVRNLGHGRYSVHVSHAYAKPGQFQITFQVSEPNSPGTVARDKFFEPEVDVQP
jgi:hypothetical protein